MAHEIETFGDKAAFVSYRELPWHRLGTVSQDPLDVQSALDLAHLSNWNVRKTPMTAHVPVGEDEYALVPVPDKFAVVRDNPFQFGQVDVLGVVGDRYEPVQNEEHAAFLDALIDGGMRVETAGSLRDGKEVFVTMKAPDTIKIGGVDPVDIYLSALNTHDGSKSFRVITTPVRVVCANTQAAALRAATGSFSKRHTSGNGGAVARARDTLGITFNYAEQFEAEAEKMVQESMTRDQFWDIVKDLYPVADTDSDLIAERKRDRQTNLVNLFSESPTISNVRGTRWAGYQAITEYLDHFSTIPGAGPQEARVRRAEKIMSGEFNDLKQNAFRILATV